MPKVVSNTTPIISLLKLNRLDLLKQLYRQIYIPEAVYNVDNAYKEVVNMGANIVSEPKETLKKLEVFPDT